MSSSYPTTGVIPSDPCDILEGHLIVIRNFWVKQNYNAFKTCTSKYVL